MIAPHRDAVRRAATLMALPMHGTQGAKLVWETADTIWTALGDPSEDYNWYTKRAILASVWGATVLFWLGDDSADFASNQGLHRPPDRRRHAVREGQGLGEQEPALPCGLLGTQHAAQHDQGSGRAAHRLSGASRQPAAASPGPGEAK